MEFSKATGDRKPRALWRRTGNDADQMRGQFNGLKDLIGAINTMTAALTDDMNTVPQDEPAQVNLSETENTLPFSFDLSRA